MSELPEWMYPPREEGWYAEDLDNLPEAPRHTELLDGALIFNMSPQRTWHSRVITALTNRLTDQIVEGFRVEREITVRLNRRNRPEPDIIVTTVVLPEDTTFADAADVALTVEVVSPESEDRDRKVKPEKYAAAGIAHYWRVEEDDGDPVVYVYELDAATGSYGLVAVVRDRLRVSRPFPIDIDVASLRSR